jgi:O-antigen ligase
VTGLCVYALATRLVPDRFGVIDAIGGYRLSEPIGYWNALGLCAGLGALLALGLAARGAHPALRAAAAASVPVLLATLYFTFSRGAWAALAAGAAALLLVDRRRLQLLAAAGAVLPFAGGAVALAWHSEPLTTPGFATHLAVEAGHRLLWQLALLCAGAALAALVVQRAERRLEPPRWVARAATATVTAVAAIAVVGALAAYGAPWTLAERGWHAFSDAPTAGGASLNGRLFQLSGNGRVAQWRVASAEVDAHPVLGGGAGSFERWWDGHRPAALKVSDVHSLYLETLAELGPVGLALLCALLVLPLLALRRARDAPLASAATGAYVAYLVHAGVDWDWEVVAVTLVALVCSVALLAGDRPRPLSARGRNAGLVAVVALTAVSVWLLGGRVAIERAAAAADRGDWPTAVRDTRRAAWLTPWSAEPWRRLGEAQLAARRFADARVSIRRALDRDRGDWRLWLDLAKTSDGAERATALDRAERLNPRGREVLGYRALLRSLSRLGGAG